MVWRNDEGRPILHYFCRFVRDVAAWGCYIPGGRVPGWVVGSVGSRAWRLIGFAGLWRSQHSIVS